MSRSIIKNTYINTRTHVRAHTHFLGILNINIIYIFVEVKMKVSSIPRKIKMLLSIFMKRKKF